MAKVLIVSDSHGLSSELEELKRRHEHEVEMMIHCGDSELPKDQAEIENFLVVKGNCDHGPHYKNELVQNIEGLKIYITHGHLYSVKSSLMSLLYRAHELDAQIICFGHTHILGAEMVKGKLFINPGSLRFPIVRKERTYVILDVQDGEVYFHVFDFDQGEIKDLAQSFSMDRN